MKEYLMKRVKKSRHNHAVFFNTIDTVIRSEEEEFKIYGEAIDKEYAKDDSVRYYFNSLGFRSDEFTDSHNGEHVLFAGCSETEGMGGNLDSCWSYMTYKKLSETSKLSGFFNLSRGGWGHDVIIPNIIEYINKYGKPDKIYMLFPNLSRDFEWMGEENEEEIYVYSIKSAYYNQNNFILPDGKIRKRQTLKEQRTLIVKFINLLKLFEEYCISNDIELKWSTYMILDGENYESLNVFKNFVNMSGTKEGVLKSDHILNKEKHKQKDLLKKRDGHHGYFYHYWWSQTFLGLVDTK